MGGLYFFFCVFIIWLVLPSVARADILYLELVINGKTNSIITAVNQSGNSWFIAASDLRAAGVQLPETMNGIVDMSSIQGASVAYNQSLQKLVISLPSSYLPAQFLGKSHNRQRTLTPRSSGMVLNYDIFSIQDELAETHKTSVWHELTMFNASAFITSTGIYRDNQNRNDSFFAEEESYTRFDTRLQYDQPDQLWSVSLGDVINGGSIWTRSLRMGGLRLSRDYSIDPQFVTYPVPEFFGEAALPSTVELLINSRTRLRESIEPGPFVIDVPTYLTGASVAQLVTTDMQGRTNVEQVSFYVSSHLLKKGLFDYDVAIGYPRENFGYRSDDYAEELASSVRLRYGLTDWFTPEIVSQSYEDLDLWGIGTTLRVGLAGVLEVTGNRSETAQYEAWQRGVGYQYQRGGFGLSVRNIERDEGYADLSTSKYLIPARRELQAVMSFTQRILGNFSVGYFRFDRDDDIDPFAQQDLYNPNLMNQPGLPTYSGGAIMGPQPFWSNKHIQKNEFVNVSWGRTFPLGISLYASAIQDLNTDGVDWSVSVSVPLGGAGQVGSTVRENDKGQKVTQVNWQRNAPYAGGIGWNLGHTRGDNEVDYYQARVNLRSSYANLSIGSYGTEDSRHHYAGLGGAIVLMDWNVFLTREIPDAFALVDASLPNVPVYSGQRLVGHTNRWGKALLPDLSAYVNNNISIDPLGFSAQTVFDVTEKTVIPSRRGGIKVDFPVENLPAAIITLVDSNGDYLPVGTELRIQRSLVQLNTPENELESIVVGWDGEIFLQPFNQPVRLLWIEGNCAAWATPPSASGSDLPRTAPLTCQPRGSAQP